MNAMYSAGGAGVPPHTSLQKMAQISSIVAQRPGKGDLLQSFPNSEEEVKIEETK